MGIGRGEGCKQVHGGAKASEVMEVMGGLGGVA